MTRGPTTQERIDAIRAVRLAAHELANACAAIVGGTKMAISLPTVDMLGKPINEDGGGHEH